MDAISGTILALASNLVNGAAAADQLDFELAAREFGRVVAASNAAPQMAEAARLFRAQVLSRAGDTNGATDDLSWVLAHANDDALRREASKLQERLGGNAGGAGVNTLLRAWRSLVGETARGGWSRARERVTGRLRQLTDALDGMMPAATNAPVRPGAGLAWVTDEWRNARAVEALGDEDTGTLTLERNDLQVTLRAHRTPSGWVFDDLLSMRRLDAADAAVAPADAVAAAAVAQGLASAQAFAHVMALGGALNVMGPRVEIRSDIAAAAPTNAARPEAAATPEQRREIEDLIRRLGADDPVERARARQRLKQIGPAALGILTEHRNSADIEVATTVRELLEEIR